MILALTLAAAAGYSVHIGRLDLAMGIGLSSIAFAIQEAGSKVAHRIGVLEGYLDALLSKDDPT